VRYSEFIMPRTRTRLHNLTRCQELLRIMNHQSKITGLRAYRSTQHDRRVGMRLTVPSLAVMLAVLASLLLAASAGAADAAQQQAMDKAAALLKTAGVSCTVSDARKLSPAIAAKLGTPPPAAKVAGDAAVAPPTVGMQADAGGQTATSAGVHGDYGASPATARKPAAVDAYEVTCSEGLGYVTSAVGGKNPFSYLCIEAMSEPASAGAAPDDTGLPPCTLPGNLPAAQLTAVHAYVTQAGIVCEPIHLRSLGQTDTDLVLELACVGGSGYILSIPYPLQPGQAVKSANCLSLAPGGRVTCQLTDVTAQRGVAEVQMRQAKPACQISASRYMVSSLHGDNYFEFLCEDGTGFVLQQKPTGDVGGTVSCSAAVVAKLGGCQLGKTNP
jgi:hypothetical protein